MYDIGVSLQKLLDESTEDLETMRTLERRACPYYRILLLTYS